MTSVPAGVARERQGGRRVKASFQMLAEEEKAEVHERTLRILANTGVRVDTAQGRRFLQEAGAEVNENAHLVRFPKSMVEEALELVTKTFTLGARRPGWDLEMNAGECTLVGGGEAVFVVDRETGERRTGTYQDWLEATVVTDSLDEFGLYWTMIAPDSDENFSKHVQEPITNPASAPWFLEVLQAIFGDKETIRRRHPVSFLACPMSPLIIEGPYTDAYLALLGWDIPLAVMPMPILGSTSPGSLISTITLANCEVMAMLCLSQAAAPGTPFIYAPVFGVMDPRTGGLSERSIVGALMAVAGVEMARYYGLPATGGAGGSGLHMPSTQAEYERSLGSMPGILAWPDILVGAGLMGGGMTLSLEQLLIDVEIFKTCRRMSQGIATDEGKWLEDVLATVGPGGHFLAQRSTLEGIDAGEWHLTDFGWRGSFEAWERKGRPELLDALREQVANILEAHKPLPLGEDVERELERIASKAQEYEAS
jgi:trimethylamine--corrinoid protein Co-methyltransferase